MEIWKESLRDWGILQLIPRPQGWRLREELFVEMPTCVQGAACACVWDPEVWREWVWVILPWTRDSREEFYKVAILNFYL